MSTPTKTLCVHSHAIVNARLVNFAMSLAKLPRSLIGKSAWVYFDSFGIFSDEKSYLHGIVVDYIIDRWVVHFASVQDYKVVDGTTLLVWMASDRKNLQDHDFLRCLRGGVFLASP